MSAIATSPAPRRARAQTAGRQETTWVVAVVVLLVGLLAYFCLFVPDFRELGVSGILALSEQFLFVGLIALGEALVIFAGEIDLSTGAMSSLSGIVMATLWQHGLNIWLAVVVALVAAALGGAINGLFVTRFGIYSLLVTLGTQFIFGSVATAVGGSTPPYNFPGSFVDFAGTGTVGPIPDQLIIFAVIAAAVWLLVARTRYGRGLVLVGYNRAASRYAGVNVQRTLFTAFVLSGLLAGVAGIFVSGFYNAARDDIGDSLLLPAITVVVLGGVDIFGGRGRMSGVIIAAFLLGFLNQGLLISGQSSLAATMVEGIVLVLCLILKITLNRRAGVRLMELLRRRFGNVQQIPAVPDA
ncbi:MAG: ABC transporter permease [Acidimicrobiales bacterium]|jgi:ribose/xylose/arabinose/galactoside ABC-type transport system permease subunit